MPPKKNQTPAFNLEELKSDGAAQKEAIAAKLDLQGAVKLGEEIEKIEKELLQLALIAQAKSADLEQVQNQLATGMTELGLKGLDLASGARIELTEVVSASISEENAPGAHQWLRDNNLGDLIKNMVTVSFGKGEDGYAKLLLNLVETMRDKNELRCGFVEQKEAVHTSTLKSFVKARIAAGDPLPLELFKVYQGVRAGLVKPKRQKV